MKKLILLALMSAFAMSDFISTATINSMAVESKDKKLCKAYIEKAHSYQDTMRSDALAQATLDLYKDRVVTHCSAVALNKKPMDPFAAKFVLENVEAKMKNVEICKMSIKNARDYKDTVGKEDATLDSYKKDVVANCGTISAKV